MAIGDYYELLGLARGASDADIKKAYRKLAQRWHPDVNQEPEAAVKFKEINEAYQVLSDPERRQRYDLFGAAGAEAGPGQGFGGFADIFDAFFGASAAGAIGAADRPPVRTCATTSGSRSRRRSSARRRRSSSRSSGGARRAAATARSPAPSRSPARSATAGARSGAFATRCSGR